MKKSFPLLFISMILYWSCEEEVDTTPPTVSILLEAGQSVNEIVTIVVETNDNEGISKVEFYIDDSLFFTDLESPYQYEWNTTQYDDNSEHIVKVISYDNSDNSTTAQPILLRVDNSTSYPNGGNRRTTLNSHRGHSMGIPRMSRIRRLWFTQRQASIAPLCKSKITTVISQK